jgi:hypothetical protein
MVSNKKINEENKYDSQRDVRTSRGLRERKKMKKKHTTFTMTSLGLLSLSTLRHPS